MFLFARQGAAQFLYCGRCKVVEVELPSSRSSLVKLTFELIDFDTLQKDVKSDITDNGAPLSRMEITSDILQNDSGNNMNKDEINKIRKKRKSDDNELKVSSSFFAELVSTHREEMEVLFGAYSRAAVEEKRLQRLMGASPSSL